MKALIKALPAFFLQILCSSFTLERISLSLWPTLHPSEFDCVWAHVDHWRHKRETMTVKPEETHQDVGVVLVLLPVHRDVCGRQKSVSVLQHNYRRTQKCDYSLIGQKRLSRLRFSRFPAFDWLGHSWCGPRCHAPSLVLRSTTF